MIKIFVPLGTQKFPFERIIRAINSLIEKNLYKEDEILMQSMLFPITPQFKHVNMIANKDFNCYMSKAEIIITHSGVNSIISAMSLNKPLIICPRLKKFGEHVDNHQDEIATLMQDKYDVIVCRDMKDLEDLIIKAPKHTYKPWSSNKEDLIHTIKKLII